MNVESRTLIFENLPIHKAVFKQIVPAIASQMITLIYNLADTYFVGLINDPRQIAAITVTASTFLMLTAISNLFGVGGASVIAKFLGRKLINEAKEVASIVFWLGLLSSGIYSIIFAFWGQPILFLCGATEATIVFASKYANWAIVVGGPFVILNIVLANLIRAEGNSIQASIGVSIGGLLNIILDPIFVLPQFLGMGAVGAGLATTISNLVSTVYFIQYTWLQKEHTIVNFRIKYLPKVNLYFNKILAIGIPSALQYALTVVAVAAQSYFVSKYPTEALAGLGITKKLDQIPLYFSIGTANGLLPLLAYNHSAGNITRRRSAFKFGCTLSVSFSICCLIIYEIFAFQLAGLFIHDEQTIYYAAEFLKRMVTAMPFMAFCYPMIIQFQAMGKVKEALVSAVLRKGILDIPLLFLMDALVPLYGCMWVQPIVDIVSLVVAIILYIHIKKIEDYATPATYSP